MAADRVGERLNITIRPETGALLAETKARLKGKLNVSKICDSAINEYCSKVETTAIEGRELDSVVARLKGQLNGWSSPSWRQGFQKGREFVFKVGHITTIKELAYQRPYRPIIYTPRMIWEKIEFYFDHRPFEDSDRGDWLIGFREGVIKAWNEVEHLIAHDSTPTNEEEEDSIEMA